MLARLDRVYPISCCFTPRKLISKLTCLVKREVIQSRPFVMRNINLIGQRRQALLLVPFLTPWFFPQDSGELRGCAPITYCGFSNFNAGQMITVTEEGGFTTGEVFFPVLRREGCTQVDQFITGWPNACWKPNWPSCKLMYL